MYAGGDETDAGDPVALDVTPKRHAHSAISWRLRGENECTTDVMHPVT
jgi:hypothetical protein